MNAVSPCANRSWGNVANHSPIDRTITSWAFASPVTYPYSLSRRTMSRLANRSYFFEARLQRSRRFAVPRVEEPEDRPADLLLLGRQLRGPGEGLEGRADDKLGEPQVHVVREHRLPRLVRLPLLLEPPRVEPPAAEVD